MLITECGVLIRAIKSLLTAIDHKAKPPFDHILLEPVAGGVAISAGDGNISASVTVPGADAFVTLLPAVDLLAAVSGAAAHDTIVFTRDGIRVNVAYPGATTTLLAHPLTHLGEANDSYDVRDRRFVDVAAFGSALAWVAAAMSRGEPARHHLESVLFDGDQLVATDGKRLHRATVLGMNLPRLLVPTKAVELLLRILPRRDQLEVARTEGKVRFTAGAWTITASVLDHAQFPAFQHVVPAPAAAAFTLELAASALTAGLRRIGVVRGKRSMPLSLRCNGKIALATTGLDVQRTADVAVTASTHDEAGDDHVVGIDGRFLRDAIALDGDVTVRFCADALAPVVIETDSRLAVVMPWRL